VLLYAHSPFQSSCIENSNKQLHRKEGNIRRNSTLYQLTELDKVREFKIRNRQPQTVIIFKLYYGKTPVEICKLLGGLGNDLPWDLKGIRTRIDYNYAGYKVDCSECLVFFKVTGGDLPLQSNLIA